MTVTTHIADGLGLLERYVPGHGTLLASPNRTVLTQDVIAVVPAGAQRDQLADLPQRARASLEDSGGPLVIGALPFDIAAPARLVVPATVDVAAPLALWPDDAQTRVVGGEWTVTIRCGEVCADRVRLWAGAGIVGACDPRAELAETTAKTQTMLDAMGLT